MKYPLITEYVEAVSSAADNLDDHDPLLASLRPVVQEGRPFYSSGNYAVVFKMKAPDGRLYAMKCWHKEMPGRDERYDLIAEELDSVQSSYLLGVRYCAEGLFVDSATADGELFPVLLMDWVEGTPLDAYLRTHRHDGYALGMVAYRFGLMAQWLMGQSFAHGDLKPDNILVRPDGTLVLVDYDGMFVPAMRGMAALECGTPNFRHPARTAQQFDEHTDDFTLAHIAAALKAVALQPALLDAMPQDALLFTDDDFRDLAHSPVLSTLQALLADAEMARLTGLLLIAHAEGGLSQPMQPLFRLARPQKVEEVLSTKVTKEDLANAIEDEYGVKYSPDGKRLLRGNGNLREYQVRPGTKVICDSAFEGCVYLQSIILPDSVTHIGDSAFEWCNSLQSITLPDSVTHIGDSAFYGCSSLQSVTLPDSVTHIGTNPFANSGIKEVISRSVHFKVQDSCLYNADGTHLISYFGCEESITLPDSVTHIGDRAFAECSSLQSITLPESVTHIGNSAFGGCYSLHAITLPDSVTHIGDSAFYECKSLREITLPDSVTHIGDRAFGYCKSLQSITLPESVTHIGTNPFVGSGIKEIISHSVHFKVQDSCLYNADGTHLISYFGREKFVTLPDSVTHIGDRAFAECSSLQSITLPDSVTHIGDRAFAECSSLQSITLPDSVTHIDDSAFFECKSLQSITLPDSVTHIGDSAFSLCYSLQSITLPDSVTHIGDHAFSHCYSLQSITLPDSVTHIGDSAFAYCKSLRSITLPDSVTHIGDSAFCGCHSLQSITLPDSVTHIGDNAFMDCSSLQSITLPDSVTHIGKEAFYRCKSLQSITLPDSVTHIGDRAFFECKSLQSITLPDSVTHIGDRAFYACSSLQSITLPDSVTHIGSNPFEHSGIKVIISHSVHFKVQDSCLYNADGTHLITYFGREESVTLPDSVTHIGDSAFYGCHSLQSITLPESVTHIGGGAFRWCKSLQSIILPDSVTHIGDYAFMACDSLQSITLPDSVTHIGDSAFLDCDSLQRIVVPKGCGEKYRKMLPEYEAELVEES